VVVCVGVCVCVCGRVLVGVSVCMRVCVCCVGVKGLDVSNGQSRSQTLPKSRRGAGVLSDISCHMGWGHIL